VTLPPGIPTRLVVELVPSARNARTHSPEQVDAIAASIVAYGFNNPVLIDESGEIVAGHGRVLAAQQLGLERVPVVVLAHLTEPQRRAYLLADNRLAELAGWDQALLTSELVEIAALGIDLATIGFSEQDLDALRAPDIDPFAEWAGMPEFEHAKKDAYQTIALHLKDPDAVARFSALIGQPIGPRTKYIWFPPAEIGCYANRRYTTEPPSDEKPS
jgi:ParB-like chromosome segregation protein Spo0J